MTRTPTRAEDSRFARELVDLLEETLVPLNEDETTPAFTCAPILRWIRHAFRPEDIFTEHQLLLWHQRHTGERP